MHGFYYYYYLSVQIFTNVDNVSKNARSKYKRYILTTN